MEKGQSEVTNKIRSSIKKKLAEISDFVDDELPDYIMIMVANQRSKSQIEKDLSLFLRNDTVKFTNWLWDLLNNVKVCTKNNQSSDSRSEVTVTKKNIEADEDAVIIDFEPDEHETDFFSNEDTNDDIKNKSPVTPLSLQINEKKETPAMKSILNCKHTEKDKTKPKSPVKLPQNVSVERSKEPLSSAIIAVKKKMRINEYDPIKPEYKKSECDLFTRKYGGTAALQANKLLLRAVDDATKSILDGKNLEDFYKPTPIKVLSSKPVCKPSKCRNDNLQSKKIFGHKMVPQPDLISDVTHISNFEVNEFSSDNIIEEDDADYEILQNRAPIVTLKHLTQFSNDSEVDSIEYIENSNYPYSLPSVHETRPKSPHFIVTLDGISRTSFKRKFEEDSVDSREDDDTDQEEPSSNEAVSVPEKKLKIYERCKYWPACKNSDHCSYHHPTVACKCFPDCKFGDKCLYIHPNCKFDALCSRKDCPFTHASKRKLPFIAVPVKMMPIKSRKMKTFCKFYPKCGAKNCPFIHPKLCRYGTDCRLPFCLYGHFPVPSRKQMKWHATFM